MHDGVVSFEATIYVLFDLRTNAVVTDWKGNTRVWIVKAFVEQHENERYVAKEVKVSGIINV